MIPQTQLAQLIGIRIETKVEKTMTEKIQNKVHYLQVEGKPFLLLHVNEKKKQRRYIPLYGIHIFLLHFFIKHSYSLLYFPFQDQSPW